MRPGNPLHLRVSDNGCGIPAEIRKHIFEPFFSARQGGTGLGLFLSINFVRRWGGNITVESVPGEGSSGAPHVRIRGFSLWGSVAVKRKKRTAL